MSRFEFREKWKGEKTIGKEAVNKIVQAKKQFPAKKNGNGNDKAEKKKSNKQDEGNKWKSKPREIGRAHV